MKILPLSLAASLIATGFCVVPQAKAANALERAIQRLEPCKNLKVKAAILTVGIDRTESVSVQSATIEVKGSQAHADATASITCRTSDELVLQGDASITVHAVLGLDLETCAPGDNTIDVVSTGGSLGEVVELLKDVISAALTQQLTRQLQKLCQ